MFVTLHHVEGAPVEQLCPITLPSDKLESTDVLEPKRNSCQCECAMHESAENMRAIRCFSTKTGVLSFVFDSSNLDFLSFSHPLVRPAASQKRLGSCSSESSGQCSRSRCTIPAVRTCSLIGNRPHGSQRSFDVFVQELHVAHLAVPNELQSRISFHRYRLPLPNRQ